MTDPILNLIVIRSADLDRSAQFYAALGVRLGRERHGSGPEHLAGMVGSTVFEVYPAGDSDGTAGVRLGFRVGSVDGAAAAAVAAGGSAIAAPRKSSWGFRAVVADPDGHRVELVEPVELD